MRELGKWVGGTNLPHYKRLYEHIGLDYKGQAVLHILADLWCPYEADNITATISCYLKGQDTPLVVDKTFTERPYPNKKVVTISKRFGRKKTQEGIPVVFDSIEELLKVERVEIIWQIDTFQHEYVIADYPIQFAPPTQSNIYSLNTYERTPLSDERKKDNLIAANGRLENTSSVKTYYDDFYYIVVRKRTPILSADENSNSDTSVTAIEETIGIAEELHGDKSPFRIDVTNLTSIPPCILDILQNEINEYVLMPKDMLTTIYYYHANVTLTDDT